MQTVSLQTKNTKSAQLAVRASFVLVPLKYAQNYACIICKFVNYVIQYMFVHTATKLSEKRRQQTDNQGPVHTVLHSGTQW